MASSLVVPILVEIGGKIGLGRDGHGRDGRDGLGRDICLCITPVNIIITKIFKKSQ